MNENKANVHRTIVAPKAECRWFQYFVERQRVCSALAAPALGVRQRWPPTATLCCCFAYFRPIFSTSLSRKHSGLEAARISFKKRYDFLFLHFLFFLSSASIKKKIIIINATVIKAAESTLLCNKKLFSKIYIIQQKKKKTRFYGEKQSKRRMKSTAKLDRRILRLRRNQKQSECVSSENNIQRWDRAKKKNSAKQLRSALLTHRKVEYLPKPDFSMVAFGKGKRQRQRKENTNGSISVTQIQCKFIHVKTKARSNRRTYASMRIYASE